MDDGLLSGGELIKWSQENAKKKKQNKKTKVTSQFNFFFFASQNTDPSSPSLFLSLSLSLSSSPSLPLPLPFLFSPTTKAGAICLILPGLYQGTKAGNHPNKLKEHNIHCVLSVGGGNNDPSGVEYLHIGCRDGVSLIHEFEEVQFDFIFCFFVFLFFFFRDLYQNIYLSISLTITLLIFSPIIFHPLPHPKDNHPPPRSPPRKKKYFCPLHGRLLSLTHHHPRLSNKMEEVILGGSHGNCS